MPPEKEKPGEPVAEAKPAAGGNKMMLIVVGVLALWGAAAPFLFRGGAGDHPPEKPAPHPEEHGENPEMSKETNPAKDPVPGPRIEIPSMTFPMQSTREGGYPGFKIAVVVILNGAAKSEDEEAKKRAAEVQAAVEESISWIAERVHDIIYRIPPTDRDQLLYEDGAKRLADEIRDVINKRFKSKYGEDVVKEVWLPERRPVY